MKFKFHETNNGAWILSLTNPYSPNGVSCKFPHKPNRDQLREAKRWMREKSKAWPGPKVIDEHDMTGIIIKEGVLA